MTRVRVRGASGGAGRVGSAKAGSPLRKGSGWVNPHSMVSTPEEITLARLAQEPVPKPASYEQGITYVCHCTAWYTCSLGGYETGGYETCSPLYTGKCGNCIEKDRVK